MNLRTDLALESRELLGEREQDGIEYAERSIDNARITAIRVTNEAGAHALGRPMGQYVTVEVPPFSSDAELFDGRLTAISRELSRLLPKEGLVLVAGLGNSGITPDAIGPKAVDYILATRHIGKELAASIGLQGLRPVAAVVPGVLGKTGMETSEIIRGLVEGIHPAAVVVIDALASRRLSRLGCTVQMSDTGISPGSGVGNHRREISEKTVGVPVISMGVPTVVDAATLAMDLLEDSGHAAGEEARRAVEPRGTKMMVTPREIDLLIERGARLMAMGINTCLQPGLSAEDLFSLVS